MATTLEKLNLKGQQEIVVLNAPASFEKELARLRSVQVHRHIHAVQKSDFILAFVTHKIEVDALAHPIDARAQGDAIVWFAYPKGTSKKYDFNRDNGWNSMQSLGFDTVRAVAIDEDWSALRLRRNQYIKSR
jgi:hypothetical protein